MRRKIEKKNLFSTDTSLKHLRDACNETQSICDTFFFILEERRERNPRLRYL